MDYIICIWEARESVRRDADERTKMEGLSSGGDMAAGGGDTSALRLIFALDQGKEVEFRFLSTG